MVHRIKSWHRTNIWEWLQLVANIVGRLLMFGLSDRVGADLPSDTYAARAKGHESIKLAMLSKLEPKQVD